MTGTIADRLAVGAGRGFVGRERELSALTAAVTAPEPSFLVAFVHGPGGIGKSRLLRQLVAAVPAGTATVVLDGRDVEPTPRGFRQAMAGALGLDATDPGTADVVGALRDGGADRVLLTVDTYETLGLLDGWLRTRFLPALPASVTTVFAGRDRPAGAWHTAAGWAGMVAEFRLDALSEPEAMSLLRSRGLDGAAALQLNAFAHGHPLALELGAAGARAGARGTPVLPELADAFLGGLPSTVVTAVEAASTVRRVTEPVLGALLGDDHARTAFDALRALPITDVVPDGLLLHDVVRDTVGLELAVRDPDARRAFRRRAARYYTNRPDPADGDLWRHTADLIFLIENPVVRDACFPSARPDHAVEQARSQDGPVIAEIAAGHEPRPCADALARWWDRHPESFAVARGPDGEVSAFVQIIELADADPGVIAADPVTRPWTDHLRANPPSPDDRVLLMRRWLGRESGELRSPGVSACWLDVKRVYMELRPRLRRLYSTVVDLSHLGPIFLPLGFAPIGDPVEVDGVAHQGVFLDFGPRSVDGWLGRLVESETRQERQADGLSPRETEVLRLVASGLSNRDVGATLHISERTASRHVSNLLLKLGVRTRTEAARIAAERGILDG
ncbi:helix-turn-helix transcriptional regulator [Pseudonocardia endophytica]|uniref:AAA ATPase-like protein n=1 Tax=Pseudonocardia endophytica TaxID=401976 RepID=A0A4R1HLU6_PSEEN|nr:LuxR C-terminal-related transcriptional regulator [Pseudonocardia endophytica]TCK20609.1 AAA ATPase-like protein [Pseudonocardia endophytica]